MAIPARETFRAQIEAFAYDILSQLEKDIRQAVREYLDFVGDDVPSADELWDQVDNNSPIFDLIDQAVPIWTKDQNDLFWAFGDEIESAFDDVYGAEAKKDDGWPMGWKAAALFVWLESKIRDRCDVSWCRIELELWATEKEIFG